MNDDVTSIDVGRAALRMAISNTRQDEQATRQLLAKQNMQAVAVDFGGEFVPSVKKIIERAVVAAQRQNLVPANHIGEGAVAGAVRAALEQISAKAVGLNVGGKIGIARYGEHLCVAVYFGVGVLNLNEVAVGLAHRSLPSG
ncbi:HutP family protein [Sporomusa acidovorans]|uniref:Hut operon positive regulatory protein n=1 Tax=Sporomusa acidovorans (strain ATCC 49682 / DSM 3132 / Mol) TaxID=1123286 RepID=A0ABZ3J3T5_SPOA4|nr:HutP family protein [Sporomusa acidovorans]OZC23099.1 HutP [Sporomusa acidovorans DSM 3132]SDF05446.1 HutP protein [Sporomusa acidovorans]